MCDLICDVITCCDTGKINASYKIMFEKQKKEKYENKRYFSHKSPSRRSFTHRIHSLLRRADATGNADIIYRF